MSELGPPTPEQSQPQEGNPLLTGWMIVAIVAIVALASLCVTALLTHGPSSNATVSTTSTKPAPVSTTTTVAPTTTVLPTTTIPQTTTTTASLANFLGSWSMHDGQLTITADGAGTMVLPGIQYGECYQNSHIKVSPVSAVMAEATITSIDASGCTGDTPSFNPMSAGGTNEELSAGSTITLTFTPPGVQTSVGVQFCDRVSAVKQACGAAPQ